MIRTPLTFHSPEIIYQFLRNNVGPLYMALKNNHAIVHFSKPDHLELAVSKYHNFTLNGLPLQLLPYHDGDLEQPPQQPTQMVPEPVEDNNVIEVSVSQHKLSEFTLLIEQALKVGDPSNVFEAFTKKSRKDLIEFINAFNSPLEAAQIKKAEIQAGYPDQRVQTQKLEEFAKFYQNGLGNLSKNMKQDFRVFRRSCHNFGGQENVQLDPNIEIVSLNNKPTVETESFKTYIQYINQDSHKLKRVAALNEKQFVCTALNYPQEGRLLFYKTDDEYIQMTNEVKEGAYGLLVLDSHILVGNNLGSICFFTTPNITQREVSLKLHGGMIYEIVKNSSRLNGYNVMTLGCDNLLKLWNVNVECFADNASTLFFEESLKIGYNSKQISSVDVLSEGHKIAYASQRHLLLHDCVSAEPISTISCKGNILKLATIDENNIGVANEKYLSFIDIRNNANTQNYRINKDVKTLTILNEYTAFYACMDGQVGVIDRRNSKSQWKNTTNHKEKVYDVCRIGSMVISADFSGQLVSWIPNDQTPTFVE